MPGRLWIGAALANALLLRGAVAAAALADDVDQMRAAWARSATVERLRPRLLSRGERNVLLLPAWAANLEAPGCTTVAILAHPNVGFALQLASEDGRPRSSQVGWVQVTRCGREREDFQAASVEMRSPRGIIETLVALAPDRMPAPSRLLSHRDPGPASAQGEAGPAPLTPSLERRAQAWVARATHDGASRVKRQVLRGLAAELPSARVDLPEGCHRFAVSGLQTVDGDVPRDLDLIVRNAGGAGRLRQDQSENSDAELDMCTGSQLVVEASVLGLEPGDPALLQVAHFPLPQGLPPRWGADTRGHFAEAFFRRRSSPALSAPIYESLGVAGRTLLPLALERSTCYVAGASLLEGRPKALSLDVLLGDAEGSSDGTSTDAAVAVGFCTEDDGFVQLRIDALGNSLAWLAAVWRVGPHGDERLP